MSGDVVDELDDGLDVLGVGPGGRVEDADEGAVVGAVVVADVTGLLLEVVPGARVIDDCEVDRPARETDDGAVRGGSTGPAFVASGAG